MTTGSTWRPDGGRADDPVGADPVLVGVDGSAQGLAAVRWAADEARRLGVGLHILHAWIWPMYDVDLGAPPLAPPGSGLRAQAERVLAAAAAQAEKVSPRTPVETSLVTGSAAAALLRHCEGACLVVVGNRGLGGFTGLLVGSVGVTVSSHAPRPVVVVRGAATPGGPVVVGVGDDSPLSAATALAAFQEAAHRHTGLVAVHAWSVPLPGDEPHRDHPGCDALMATGEHAGHELLAKALSPLEPMFPEVAVTVRLGGRSAAAELVAASASAQLVVVGTRGAGALRGLLLGSTAHALIHHAASPVFVVR